MTTAHRRKDDPTWEDRKAKLHPPKPEKKWAQLTEQEKDEVLKKAAIHLGLVKED